MLERTDVLLHYLQCLRGARLTGSGLLVIVQQGEVASMNLLNHLHEIHLQKYSVLHVAGVAEQKQLLHRSWLGNSCKPDR